MEKFLLPPDQTNYNVQDGEETKRTQLQGGAGRYRADILNSSYSARVSWTLSKAQYAYLKGFYKSRTISGSKPFLIDLIVIGGSELEERTAYFIPNSLVLSQQQGLTYKVDAQLEVLPKDSDEDELILNTLLYEIAGEDMFSYDMSGLLVDLNELVNVVMPSLEVFDA